MATSRMKRSIVFAVLAALFYALSSPVSKLLFERMGPTMLAGLLYLGAGVGLLGLRQLWAGIAFVTTACMILSVEDLSSFSFSYGSLFVLAATLCWGLENNCTRRLSDRDPMITTIIKGFGSGLGSLAIALIFGERCGSLAVLSAALALGFVAYGLSIWLYIRAQRDLGAARTSAYYALAPFMGAFLSFVLLSEMPSMLFFIALGLMVIGTVFVTRDAHSPVPSGTLA